MAADVAAIAAPGGQLVLAGLLRTQAAAVARAYRREGYRLAEQLNLGDWAILRLRKRRGRSEEHTSELQSLMRISYAVFCLKQINLTQLLICISYTTN